MIIIKRHLRRIIKEAIADMRDVTTKYYTDASGKRQPVPAGESSFPWRDSPRKASPKKIEADKVREDFEKWAVEYMGSPSGANSSSVLATYLVDQGLDDDEDLVAYMVGPLGFNWDDVRKDIKIAREDAGL